MSIKKSAFRRSLELAKLTVQLGLKEIQSESLQKRLDQARMLTQSLAQLRGAAMKAGQLLSLEVNEFFPPEAVEILSQLQNNATTTPFRSVQQILEHEWGRNRILEFNLIDPNPVASASIAQVHRAEWQQRTLALKIQHPGIAESVESDISILQRIAKTYCQLTQRTVNLEPFFEEIKGVLKQEVNFLQEAQLLEAYQKRLAQLSGPYVTPSLIKDWSTQKILAMTWEDGDTLTQWIKKDPPPAQRMELAHLVLNLFCHEFFHWGLVQTDPNFSNFLIRPKDSSFELVLLDFGSTRTYERPMIEAYIQLIEAVESGSPTDIIDQGVAFGLIDERESPATKELFVTMLTLSLEPFMVSLHNSPSQGSFDFASIDYQERSQKVVRDFVKSLYYSAPPHRILFLNRKLGGIFLLLKRLKIRMNLTPYWELMMAAKTQPTTKP